jgi:hypothetical protein
VLFAWHGIKQASGAVRPGSQLMERLEMSFDREGLMSPRPLFSSLAAFITAGLRPQSPLARAIVVVLIAKLIAVAAMMVFQFFADQHVVADAAAVSRLLGPSSLP